MFKKYKFKIFVYPGAIRELDCTCSAYDPGCPRGYNGECILIKYPYNPYEDIEECQSNTNRTYGKKHGRTRSRRT